MAVVVVVVLVAVVLDVLVVLVVVLVTVVVVVAVVVVVVVVVAVVSKQTLQVARQNSRANSPSLLSGRMSVQYRFMLLDLQISCCVSLHLAAAPEVVVWPASVVGTCVAATVGAIPAAVVHVLHVAWQFRGISGRTEHMVVPSVRHA